MEKYRWFKNNEERLPFIVIHTENGIETKIAATDSAEKAHFIAKACNFFSLPNFEVPKQSWVT